jgi:hypothetical protein
MDDAWRDYNKSGWTFQQLEQEGKIIAESESEQQILKIKFMLEHWAITKDEIYISNYDRSEGETSGAWVKIPKTYNEFRVNCVNQANFGIPSSVVLNLWYKITNYFNNEALKII